jgi:hypothetical protein
MCDQAVLSDLCIPTTGLNPQFTGLWREAVVDAHIPQGNGLPPIHVNAGDRIWASFRNAHLNVRFFASFVISLFSSNSSSAHRIP